MRVQGTFKNKKKKMKQRLANVQQTSTLFFNEPQVIKMNTVGQFEYHRSTF